MTTLYGISSCDTVRKARKWLDGREVSYRFHDFRKDGLEADMLEPWVRALGWEPLLNRRSTTWRQLAEADRQALDENKAIALMLSHPALIKRPVLAHGKRFKVGFNTGDYDALFR